MKFRKLSFEVDKETDFQLHKIKKKLERKMRRTVTWCEVMKYFVDKENTTPKVKQNIKQRAKCEQKQKVNKKISKKVAKIIPEFQKEKVITKPSKKVSRTIPVIEKREEIKKYNDRCAMPGCEKPYEHLHHPARFALEQSHENIVPLCKTHHELAHNGLIKRENMPPNMWKLQQKANKNDIKYAIDQCVIRHRHKHH